MSKINKELFRSGAVICGSALFGSILFSAQALAATQEGEAVKLGNGTAQVVVTTDEDRNPVSIAVSMTAGAFDGLPTELNKDTPEGSWEFPLPMPEGSNTGYKEVVIDWNPHGHPPPEIYTVPHFDFHFYTISPEDVDKIKFTGPDDPAAKVSDKDLIPPDYQVVPDTAVNMMGVHAIDTKAPEFNGKPFAATFIYGYDNGRLIFLEPMVTLAYLKAKPEEKYPVKAPAKYSSAGYYPSAYSVRYDSASDRYMIELNDLKSWK
jgi:hypothetical protein